jgi:TrpR-related protein YerC/YecD
MEVNAQKIKMVKFVNPSKLSKDDQEELLILFCRAISKLKTPQEAANFLKDLLSSQEAEMLAKRLKTAELLIKGKKYSEIGDDLKVGPGTISRVHEWLKLSGDGFRMVLERVPKNSSGKKESIQEKMDPFSWRNIKRRYPAYFWPQLLLEQVIKSANKKNRQRIVEAMSQMDKKSALYKQLSGVFKKKY